MVPKPGLFSRLRAELVIFQNEYHEMASIRSPWLRYTLRFVYLLLFPLYFALALLFNPLLAKGLDWIATRGIDDSQPDTASDCEQYRKQHMLLPENVPPDLQYLLPLAEQFGLAGGEYRQYYLSRATPGQIEQVHAVTARAEQIYGWLQSFAEGEISAEASAYMNLLHAGEELGLVDGDVRENPDR